MITADGATGRQLLTVADGCLVLSHRLSEWMSRGPTMEEDIALGNIALDLLGQARGLYQLLGDEDRIAYFRDPQEWRNPLICELPNGDFGFSVLRLLFVSAWLADVWPAMAGDAAGVAEKALKENAYHLRHSSAWVIRLGDGTDESHARMLAALDRLWMFTGALFVDDDVARALAPDGVADLPSTLQSPWRERVSAVLSEATLPVPPEDAWMQRGGPDGRHTEHLGYLLAELQFLQRAYPGATW